MLLFQLPLADPGRPDLRSPVRFLAWLARRQLRTVVQGAIFGTIWMGSQAVLPAAVGAAINAMVGRDEGSLVKWCLVVLALGTVQAVAGVLRHRRAVSNFLSSIVIVDQLLARHAARLGASLPRRIGEGEVASIGTTDVTRIGRIIDITARGTGAAVSYCVVVAIMLSSSVWLGLVVLLGVPLGALLVVPVMKPLERRQWAEREARGAASEVAADTVAGLRVLRGLGGEEDFRSRYLTSSQAVRRATVRTAKAQSALQAARVFTPGAVLVAVTFLGAHLVLRGRVSPGQLVADYAYAAFLVLPVQTLADAAVNWSAATVAAGRVLSVLRLSHDIETPLHPEPFPVPGPLVDEVTGLVVEAGTFTTVAVPDAEQGADLAERLGRHRVNTEVPGSGVTLSGVDLACLPLDDVRHHIMVLDREARLLAGTVREVVDVPPAVPGMDRPSVEEAISAACADDIVAGLDGGIDGQVAERGRSLSGGQRQRLLLAAALRAGAPVLVMHEPTSAVDAHTEAAIAENLARVRKGLTTVVIANSPLLLARADEVVMIDGGGPGDPGRPGYAPALLRGSHAQLMRSSASYRELVSRELE
ncbi:MAG TPA: ABC transporter ATP-binding protein [Acidimicrobiales bacterium]|nr:ABC transporter ATP-binding protein [Acidimicrobiales bacterium]